MDCLKTQQVLSEAIEGPVDEALLADARAHSAGCDECARFERMMARVAGLQTPKAPAELVDNLVCLGAKEAILLRESAAPSDELAEPIVTHPQRSETRFRPNWWAPRLTMFAAAAAVLLVALVATGIGLGGLLNPPTTSESFVSDGSSEVAKDAPAASVPSNSESSQSSVALDMVAAPPYIVIDGRVYAPTGSRTVDPTSLTTGTPVLTSLDTGAEPTSIPSYKIDDAPLTPVLKLADGTYIGFSAVTRTFGGETFVMESGSLLTAYGQWPTLPARFAAPTDPDGSPTFSFFGKDDIGALVYVPAGGQASTGFAVAPGTSPNDPAVGNPNWTWWSPE